MIPRIKTGASFKGAELYYLHDKRRDGERVRLTERRVAWTHTENTLSDDAAEAFAEMRKTAFDQPILKQLSGNRIDGRPTDRPVMTVSLAWAPDQEPSKEHMIATGREFLRAMGWQEHQAVFVGHQDTKHPHFHIILNKVHPETGMTLDQSWTKTRLQQWGLAYERKHGHIYCKAREERYGHGRSAEAPHLNRWEWQTWQEVHREGATDPEFRKALAAGEWDALKQQQQQERTDFWKGTGQMRKELRATLRAEVREEFRPEWRAYAQDRAQRMEAARAYDKEARRAIRHYWKHRATDAMHKIREAQADYHKRLGRDLAAMRGEIIARQKARIAELAPPALERLSKDRVQVYEGVKARHRAERAELRADQAQGKRRPDVLSPRPDNQNAGPFRVSTGQSLSVDEAITYKAQAQAAVQLKHDHADARGEVTRAADPSQPAPPPVHAGATPAQRQAAAAQAREQDKETSRLADAPPRVRRQAKSPPRGEMTDSKTAKKARAARKADSAEARERALDQAILENWGAAMERGRGGRER